LVGEVSNTPWNEMHCYVLHPDSIDQVKVKEMVSKTTPTSSTGSDHPPPTLNYLFPKNFHVSPFMEMNYWYDWTFEPVNCQKHEPIRIINSMKQRMEGDDTSVGRLQFLARLEMTHAGLSPLTVAKHLAVYPVFCSIIQLWIHYQAFWLFLKGVTFQPHPQGSETTASRLIGRAMAPFFAVKEWWENHRRQQQQSGSKGDSSKLPQ
jgi:DUF1365 family protein